MKTDLAAMMCELAYARAVYAALPRWKRASLLRSYQIEAVLGYVREDASPLAENAPRPQRDGSAPTPTQA